MSKIWAKFLLDLSKIKERFEGQILSKIWVRFEQDLSKIWANFLLDLSKIQVRFEGQLLSKIWVRFQQDFIKILVRFEKDLNKIWGSNFDQDGSRWTPLKEIEWKTWRREAAVACLGPATEQQVVKFATEQQMVIFSKYDKKVW